ncbi:MAG: SRPBCC family protein, partial [Pseudomonadota bacterium]|nr:SRPBCC family protein [Pseudomonadota bacterium]
MAAVNRSVIVPYSVAQMYALVSDIESYPDFVPGIR